MQLNTKDVEARSLLAEGFCWLTDKSARFPRLTTLVVLISVVISIVYTVQKIQFKTDRADLIDPAATFQKRWKKYTESFGDISDMVVVVESSRPESIKQVLDELGDRIVNEPGMFTNVLYKVEPGNLSKKGLQYLSKDQLVTGLERLGEYRPILNGGWELIRLESLIPRISGQLKRMDPSTSPGDDLLIHHTDRIAASLIATLRDRNSDTNPWPEILPVDPKLASLENQTVYLLNDNGTMGFLMASPVDASGSFEGATTSIDRLRTLIHQSSERFPDTKISLTGIPVLENDEMRRSQADSLMASIISYLGVAAILFLGFRGFQHPILGLLMLIVGMAWSFGYTTASVGHLNILSVSFVAILIGLGIDFAIHVLSRYLELRHQGLGMIDALVETASSVGGGIVTGAVTTSLAFFCATFTDFLGVAELGIIAGGGILLCALASFTFLPAVVALADRNTEPGRLPTPFQGRWLRYTTLHHPWLVLSASAACMGYIGYKSFDWSGTFPIPLVKYDHNLLHLQAKGLESVEAQRHIFESSQHSLLYAISVADSADEARRMKVELEAMPSVHHVQELASRLPELPSTETSLLVQAFHAELERLPDQPPEPAGYSNPSEVGNGLEELYKLFQDRSDPVSKRIADNLNEFLDRLNDLPLRQQTMFLTEFQYRMGYSLHYQFKSIAAASDPEPVQKTDLPAELRSRFVSPQGKWLLQIYPKDQVWDMEPLERFVNDVRKVDPEVTGVPLQNFEAALQIKRSYEICALYALAVIMITLLLDFSRKELLLRTFIPPLMATVGLATAMQAKFLTWSPGFLLNAFAVLSFAMAAIQDRRAVVHSLLAIMPPVVGMGITFGLLVILDIPLNPANLIILPLILGIGVDNGVHIMHDCRSNPRMVYCTAPSTINAIMLTSTTTMVGFGSMMIAAHRGLYSLGAVLTIGVGACLFVSLVTLPAILTIATRSRELVPSIESNDTTPHVNPPPEPSTEPPQETTAAEEEPDTIKLPSRGVA